MAQDKLNIPGPGSRMARIRATRLSANPDPTTIQDSESEVTISEKPPAVDISAVEMVENQQTLYLPTITPAIKAVLPENVAATTVSTTVELEHQQTLHLPISAYAQKGTTAAKPLVTNGPTVGNVEHQQTMPLLAISDATATQKASLDADVAIARPGFMNKLSASVSSLINSGMVRLQEPQPEGLFTRGLRVVKPGFSLGQFPLLTLTNASGLVLISIAYYLGQVGALQMEFSFLLGLLIIFVPNLLRLLSPAALRLERMFLLCGLGLAFYLIAFMMSSLHISSFDGFLHWVTADTILKTGHLFGDNSLLPVSPYYPGLEIITNAISSLTGLNTFFASIPLIAATRILLVLSLFLFYEQITSSSRMAGIATIIYMANPHFIFFDAIYNYETLALPLAMCAFYILARYENVGGEHRWIIFTSWIVLIAITFTHHMTDIVTDGLILLWVAASFFSAVARKTRIHLVTMAVFGIVLATAYAFLMNGNPVWDYLSSYFNIAFVELGRIITGTGASRALFAGTGATPAPIWDRLLMLGSVAIVAFCLPFGLLTIWRLHRRHALPMVLGVFALAYPIAQGFRFTPFGSEIADRSSAFLFFAVAYVLTILITHFWPTRKLSKKAIALVTCAISVVLLGGTILDAGAGFSGFPGPYMVGADGRSVEPEGINAALWTLAYLGPDNHVGTDRTNQLLMSTYGEQHVITELGDLLDVSPLFHSAQFSEANIALLRAGKIRYLVVDTRLSTAVPALGFYFVSDEPGANHITIPLNRDALTKFTTVPQINRLFDSGNIVIYDTGAFINGTGSS